MSDTLTRFAWVRMLPDTDTMDNADDSYSRWSAIHVTTDSPDNPDPKPGGWTSALTLTMLCGKTTPHREDVWAGWRTGNELNGTWGTKTAVRKLRECRRCAKLADELKTEKN